MKNIAHLKESSPFYDLFPGGQVPIRNFLLPSQVALEGDPETKAYFVALDEITTEQFNGIADRLATKEGCDAVQVMRDMVLRGLPLRASQVNSVSSDCPAFL